MLHCTKRFMLSIKSSLVKLSRSRIIIVCIRSCQSRATLCTSSILHVSYSWKQYFVFRISVFNFSFGPHGSDSVTVNENGINWLHVPDDVCSNCLVKTMMKVTQSTQNTIKNIFKYENGSFNSHNFVSRLPSCFPRWSTTFYQCSFNNI